jgi:hypothetical protein
MKDKDRRVARRSPIRVLVNCLPPGTPSRRNGHPSKGWEMWAQDIADDGVGLQWSSTWATARCAHCQGMLSGGSRRIVRDDVCECNPPNEKLKKGQKVRLDGLIYTEKGSKSMQGRIQWVRPAKNGRTCEFGVHITSPNHRRFFKALEA